MLLAFAKLPHEPQLGVLLAGLVTATVWAFLDGMGVFDTMWRHSGWEKKPNTALASTKRT